MKELSKTTAWEANVRINARPITAALAAVCLGLVPTVISAQSIVDQWRYTLRRPDGDWQKPKFDDRSWKDGSGGFGEPDTPGARVGTRWSTNNIWLRKTFELESLPAQPALLMHHDEEVQVFINGKQVAAAEGWTTDYEVVSLDAKQSECLRVGENLMAVHCRQTSGGQFIDVHLVDAKNVPELPAPERSTEPFISELITPWGSDVTPENAWTEYPRPQMRRSDWLNLNGLWDYTVTTADQIDIPADWNDSKILVPFPLESKLGGVQRLLLENEALWYRRQFDSAGYTNGRALLHFEAVDYQCKIWINGNLVGAHRGGNTPFHFDITDVLRTGDNTLVVRVEDDTEGYQLRGKQVINPRGIWYTQISGIWQTVWLESVPKTFIEDLTIRTNADSGRIQVQAEVSGDPTDAKLELVVRDGEQLSGRNRGELDEVGLDVADPKLWSPESPHLYDLQVSLINADGEVIDRVEAYAGIRTVGKRRDADGNLRFTLNGKEIFHWGPLDQGWWPDGLLTPPSDEAMRFDIEYLKQAGFNMIRKHIKVEPRRYYYHCDRLGMMLWQDQVSAGNNPPWTRLKPNPEDADWPASAHRQFMQELESMIDTLENHPSIVVWVPFNEAWGQHRTMEVGKWTVERDPSRLVNIASGGNFWPVGDIVDHHSYPHPEFPFDKVRYHDFIKVMGEFGGHGFPVEGHLWDADKRNWGYGGLPKTKQEYRQRYVTSLEKLNELRLNGIAAGVYTQTTDVEGEVNGLMTYDRKVIKIPAAELAKLHKPLVASPKD